MSSQPSPSSFEALGLPRPLLTAIAELGYEQPTPIQREAIPALLKGSDLLGQAATGTGKTAAFGLPLLSRLRVGSAEPFHALALVLVPTRELALQVTEALQSFGRSMSVSVVAIYGGQEVRRQHVQLRHGVDVVVATPGRALDHLRRKTLRLEKVRMVVLDEADEMLDMGFADDLEALLSSVPADRQMALFSATLPPRITRIAEEHLRSPVRLRLTPAKPAAGAAPKVRQTAYVVPPSQKAAALVRILRLERPSSALIFCRTRADVDQLTGLLLSQKLSAEALHGGLDQSQRDRVLRRFKEGTVKLLVATDVAARGLHVENLSHVVNYELPNNPEAYVHRIGRTGRAGREGVALSLLGPKELKGLQRLGHASGGKISVAKVPTVEDLEADRFRETQSAVQEALAANAGTSQALGAWVQSLAQKHTPLEIAVAALHLLHLARHAPTEADLQELSAAPAPVPSKKPRPEHGKPRPASAAALREVARLFVSAGKRAGMRPADLVGAITNEAGLVSAEVGQIVIADSYSLVEVPEAKADKVIDALKATTVRGRRLSVRRDRA